MAIGAKQSQMESVKNGVPPGSVLGLIIHSIYINELTEATKNEDNCNEILTRTKTTYLVVAASIVEQ